MTAVQFEKLQEPHTLMYVNPRTPGYLVPRGQISCPAFSRCRDVSARCFSPPFEIESIEERNLLFARISSSKLLLHIYIFV